MLDMWCHVITYEDMNIPFSPLRLDSIEIQRMIICHVILIIGGCNRGKKYILWLDKSLWQS
jgi:hypothetical protein